MSKPDFPALLAPGIHNLTMPALHALAVAPFVGDVQRNDLYQRFTTWLGGLHACGVSGSLWLDGSFLTEKQGPSDIDCVLWYPDWTSPASATPANEQQVRHLLDKASARSLFGLDLYIEMPDPAELMHRQAYWRGLFGFCHDRVTAKGLAEVGV
ncbi:MAG: DUF6932 family protein [Rhodanobacter sp.]|jgi:hypothetical protein